MRNWILLMVCLVMVGKAYSRNMQDSLLLWKIEMTNSNEFLGIIISENDSILQFDSKSLGLINIPVNLIKHREMLNEKKIIDGTYWADNPQASRYFWAPNAFGMKKEEGYFQNVWVLFNQVSYAPSENFTIGFGMVPLFLFNAGVTPIWITPKFSFPIKKDKFGMGGGVLLAALAGENEVFGITYGVATFGNRDRNLNIGVGYGFAGDSWAEIPTLNLSFMARTGSKGYFISENYLINEELQIFTIGGRTVLKNISLDYGGIVPIFDGEFEVVIPWLGFVVPIGRK